MPLFKQSVAFDTKDKEIKKNIEEFLVKDLGKRLYRDSSHEQVTIISYDSELYAVYPGPVKVVLTPLKLETDELELFKAIAAMRPEDTPIQPFEWVFVEENDRCYHNCEKGKPQMVSKLGSDFVWVKFSDGRRDNTYNKVRRATVDELKAHFRGGAAIERLTYTQRFILNLSYV